MLFVASAVAAGDNKDGVDGNKSKRAYSLGYGYSPYTTYYEHDVINHAPITPVVAHAPVATVHHTPVFSHAPIVAAPVLAHAPVVAPVAKITSSVVRSNVLHYPSQYIASHAPIVAPAPYYRVPSTYVAPASYYQAPASYYQAPASYYQTSSSYVAPTYAQSPLLTEFHQR